MSYLSFKSDKATTNPSIKTNMVQIASTTLILSPYYLYMTKSGGLDNPAFTLPQKQTPKVAPLIINIQAIAHKRILVALFSL